jgi:hypothetical protein
MATRQQIINELKKTNIEYLGSAEYKRHERQNRFYNKYN